MASCCAVSPRISFSVCAIRSRNCARWPVARLAPGLEQLLLAGDRGRDLASRRARASNSIRKRDRFRIVALGDQARLARRQFVELRPDDAEVARGTVSSRRTTTWPSSTWLPSLTKISPTMPPVECCTFLTFDLDHDGAGRDHGAGELRGRGPAADAAEHQNGDGREVR